MFLSNIIFEAILVFFFFFTIDILFRKIVGSLVGEPTYELLSFSVGIKNYYPKQVSIDLGIHFIVS